MMGRSIWGLINSTWASARKFGYVPDKVHILHSKKGTLDAAVSAEMVKAIVAQFGSEPEVTLELVEGGDMKAIAARVRDIIADCRTNGHRVAVDVTSGTKDLALGSTLLLTKEDADHIFYLYLDSLRDVDRPFMLIPMEIQHHHDILNEVE